jgi:hypothetical protein
MRWVEFDCDAGLNRYQAPFGIVRASLHATFLILIPTCQYHTTPQAKGADGHEPGSRGGRKRSHAAISGDPGKRAATRPPPPAAAPPGPMFGQGVLTLADFEHKRQRRTRPLDLDRPMPVVVAGRADERDTIRCVLLDDGVCMCVWWGLDMD